MNYKNEKIVDYITLGVSIASAAALLGNYYLQKKTFETNKEHIETQKELTKLLILEKKKNLEKDFKNATGIKDITSIIPNKQSKTQDWCSFYAEMKRRYGKNTANIIFAKAWDKRKGSSVNTNNVISCTNLQLDRDAIDALKNQISNVTSGLSSIFSFTSTTVKITILGGIGLVFILVGTFVFKAITFKPKEWEGLSGKLSEGISQGAIKAILKK